MDVSDQTPEVTSDTASGAAGKSLGQTLKEARTNLRLSEQDIANKLNITVSVVQSIEADAPAADLPMTFVRGYIRSYAVKVGLDSQMIQQMLEQQYGVQQAEINSIQSLSPWRTKRREFSANSGWFKAITLIIVVALVGLGGWEAWKRLGTSESDSTAVENNITLDLSSGDPDEISDLSSQSQSSESEPSQAAFDDNGGQITLQSSANTNASQTSSQPQVSTKAPEHIDNGHQVPVAEEVPSNAPAPLSLVFDFSGDCWVEVIDATGEVLAIGIKRAGKHMPLQGVPPIRVKLGAPGNVRLNIEGEPWDLSGYRPDRTASFSIGG